MKINYSQAAMSKLKDVPFTTLQEFIQGIPGTNLNLVIKSLPKVKGFRPGKDIEIRLKNYLSRLKRSNDEDWSILYNIWLTYTQNHQVIRNALKFTDRVNLDEMIRGILDSPEAYHEAMTTIVQAAHTEGLTKEVLQNWVLFSPFEPNDQIDKIMNVAPSSNDQQLKNRVALAEKRINVLEQDDTASKKILTVESDLASIQEELSKQLSGYKAEFDSIKEIESHAELRINNINNKLEKIIKKVDSIQGDNRGLITDYESLSMNVNQLTETVNEYIARIRDLNYLEDDHVILSAYVENMLKDAAKNRENREALPLPKSSPIIDTIATIEYKEVITSGTGKKDVLTLETAQEVILHLEKNIKELGIKLQHARKLALEIQAALATGQMITFEGSLATLVAERCAFSLSGGSYHIFKIPFGLIEAYSFDSIWGKLINEISKMNDISVVIFEGINRSAFEIYGEGLRKAITERIFGLNKAYDSVFFIATTVDGPSTIELSKGLLDCGPLISVDSLGWINRPTQPGQIGVIEKLKWCSEIINEKINQEYEDGIISDRVLYSASAMWRKNVKSADGYARSIVNTLEIPYEFNLFGWVFPYLLQMNRIQIDEFIEYIEKDDRLKNLLYNKLPEVMDA